MKFEISIGEYLDKWTILEIKKERIQDVKKLVQIDHELSLFDNYKMKEICSVEYKLLKYVNEKIWDMTKHLKILPVDNQNFAKIAYDIFEHNQYRFRLKNQINFRLDSNIKEQKSYEEINITILIENEEPLTAIIPYIYYVSMIFDNIHFITNRDDLKYLFRSSIFQFINNNNNLEKIYMTKDLIQKYPLDDQFIRLF
jgi:hypothetical protein